MEKQNEGWSNFFICSALVFSLPQLHFHIFMFKMTAMLKVFLISIFEQKAHYVWNKEQLKSLNPKNVDYLLGRFHFHYETLIEV